MIKLPKCKKKMLEDVLQLMACWIDPPI